MKVSCSSFVETVLAFILEAIVGGAVEVHLVGSREVHETSTSPQTAASKTNTLNKISTLQLV